MGKIENKAASSILEKEIKVDVLGKEYSVKPVSVATLIEVSRLISDLPYIDSKVDNILAETLRTARDCKVLGEIAATLILGVRRKRSFLKFFFESIEEVQFKNLSETILHMTPKQLNKLLTILITTMEIGDFFGLTTSLSEVNLLKPTKEVV